MLKQILKSDVFKNFSYLAFSELISKGIGFFVVVYVARVLGPENFGKISFAQAFVSYFGLIVNLGLDVLGTREIARDKSRAKELLSNIVSMKLFLFFISFVFLFLFVLYLPKDVYTKEVVLFYGITMLVSVFAIDWFFQGFENFKIIAISRIIRNVVYALLVFLFIKFSNQIFELISFQIISDLAGSLVLWFLAVKYFDVKSISLYKWKQFAKTGFILASSFFMISIYYNLDKVMIGLWYPDKYVGWYEASYKIIMISLILSGIFWSIFSPKIARFDKKSLFLYLKIMLVIGFFLLIFIFTLSNVVILTVFGENYMPSVSALKILAFNVFFVYINVAFVSPIMLWNEKKYFLAIGAGGIVNIVFNFLLIPKYHIIGASIATVLAEIAVFLVGITLFINIFKNSYGRIRI